MLSRLLPQYLEHDSGNTESGLVLLIHGSSFTRFWLHRYGFKCYDSHENRPAFPLLWFRLACSWLDVGTFVGGPTSFANNVKASPNVRDAELGLHHRQPSNPGRMFQRKALRCMRHITRLPQIETPQGRRLPILDLPDKPAQHRRSAKLRSPRKTLVLLQTKR